MATNAVANQTNGVKGTTDFASKAVQEYEKILALRDAVFSNTHPRLKISRDPSKEGTRRPANAPPSTASPRTQQNAKDAPLHANPPPTQANEKPAPANRSSRLNVDDPSKNSRNLPSVKPAPSGIDPVLLTDPDVLVRTDLQRKRQRIERALEEQLKQKTVVARPKLDGEAQPDIDISEVLRKARKLVKPLKSSKAAIANRTTASSDSPDENSFYSSQVNDSAGEDAAGPAKSRPQDNCWFFFEGHCRYGDACTFSHDPALKQRPKADENQSKEIKTNVADEQAVAQQNGSMHLPADKADSKSDQPSDAERSARERIAQLEEELRNLKRQSGNASSMKANLPQKESRSKFEELAYSPPDAAPNHHQQSNGLSEAQETSDKDAGFGHPSANPGQPSREYAPRTDPPHPPLPSEGRLVRSHITSPIAPQPARDSPFAATKVPDAQREQPGFSDSNRLPQGSSGEATSTQRSPHPSRPLNAKKRRRGDDVEERSRYVKIRREAASPVIQVKEEPVSPPPQLGATELWRPPQLQEVPRPVYLETDSPRYHERNIVHQPRNGGYESQIYISDERQPLTPIATQLVPRGGRLYDAPEEQDLRRVVSARQLRVPRSPLQPYSAPARATSQVFVQPPVHSTPRPAQTFVRPTPTAQPDYRRSVSPVPLRRISPLDGGSGTMPPPRRIVVDEYGQRYYAAPAPTDLRTPTGSADHQNEFLPRHERTTMRKTTLREPRVVNAYDERYYDERSNDDKHYVRRAQSPNSPIYVQYRPDAVTHQTIDQSGGQLYDDEVYVARNGGMRTIEYPASQLATQYEEVIRPREYVTKTHTVRPVGGSHETRGESIIRVPSARPETDRVLSFEARRDGGQAAGRPVSVRAGDTFIKPVLHAGTTTADRPKYRYPTEVQESRFGEDDGQGRNPTAWYEMPQHPPGRRPPPPRH